MIELLRELEDDHLPIFARKSYLSSRSGSYGWIRNQSFILPFIIDKRYIFKRLIFTTGIICTTESTSHKDEQEFLDQVTSLIREKLSVDMIAKAQANAVFNTAPKGSISAGWGTYVKKIDLNDEELMLSLPSKTRNMVRRAQKGDVKVNKASVEELWELMHETFKRQGEELMAPSLEYLTVLTGNLDAEFLILKATHEGVIQGVAGVPHDKNKGYYLFGGSIARPYAGSLNLLQFEVIRQLRDKGVKAYDFVGARLNPPVDTKYYKIQKFKTAFDPQLIEGIAFKVVLKPFKYRLLNLGLQMHSLLKGKKYLGDPIDQIREASE